MSERITPVLDTLCIRALAALSATALALTLSGCTAKAKAPGTTEIPVPTHTPATSLTFASCTDGGEYAVLVGTEQGNEGVNVAARETGAAGSMPYMPVPGMETLLTPGEMSALETDTHSLKARLDDKTVVISCTRPTN
jgi:hypothetical protein